MTRAMTTEPISAAPGRSVTHRAAAGGPIISEKMRRAPTTGTVMVVAQATTTRNAISVRWGRSPRASAISGTMEVSISRRYRTPMARTHTSPRTATGTIWLELTPRISPKSSEKICGSYSVLWLRKAAPRASIITRASAVATSGRPRRPSDPIPRAATEGEHPETDQRVDADETGSGGTGEGAVGDGVGREGCAPHHDEEADDAGHDRHQGGDLPGVGHEA